jgi:23S rRNA (cytosine1962-C5)-methyltransferase
MKSLENLLNKAIERRVQLTAITNAIRLVNGEGDGLEGLLIDRYHKHLHVQVLSDHWQAQMTALCRFLTTAMPVDYLIVKSRRGIEIKEEVLIGSQSQTIVEEHGIKFEVNLNGGLNCGLFLDMRQNRWMVHQACKAKKVLNCFSYTCSFGVHARMGGAKEVINTDISRKILERGRNNYQLNSLSNAPGEFIKADSVAFLQRAFKKGNTFDVIILDPPSFARHEGKVFQVKRDLPKLIALATAVLNPGGKMLVATNYSAIAHADLERILSRGLNGRRVTNLQRVGQDRDFPATNTFKESYLAGLFIYF